MEWNSRAKRTATMQARCCILYQRPKGYQFRRAPGVVRVTATGHGTLALTRMDSRHRLLDMMYTPAPILRDIGMMYTLAPILRDIMCRLFGMMYPTAPILRDIVCRLFGMMYTTVLTLRGSRCRLCGMMCITYMPDAVTQLPSMVEVIVRLGFVAKALLHAQRLLQPCVGTGLHPPSDKNAVGFVSHALRKYIQPCMGCPAGIVVSFQLRPWAYGQSSSIISRAERSYQRVQ